MKISDLVCGFISGAVIFGFMTAVLCYCLTTNKWQKELIKKGYAEYNSITGAWQYKEEKK